MYMLKVDIVIVIMLSEKSTGIQTKPLKSLETRGCRIQNSEIENEPACRPSYLTLQQTFV